MCSLISFLPLEPPPPPGRICTQPPDGHFGQPRKNTGTYQNLISQVSPYTNFGSLNTNINWEFKNVTICSSNNPLKTVTTADFLIVDPFSGCSGKDKLKAHPKKIQEKNSKKFKKKSKTSTEKF